MLFRSPNCCSRILQGVFVKRHRSSIHQRKNRAGTANVSSALPSPRELDSHECNSTFRELIPKFEGDGQSRPAAIPSFRVQYLKFTLRS
jgi:hypothetical protein